MAAKPHLMLLAMKYRLRIILIAVFSTEPKIYMDETKWSTTIWDARNYEESEHFYKISYYNTIYYLPNEEMDDSTIEILHTIEPGDDIGHYSYLHRTKPTSNNPTINANEPITLLTKPQTSPNETTKPSHATGIPTTDPIKHTNDITTPTETMVPPAENTIPSKDLTTPKNEPTKPLNKTMIPLIYEGMYALGKLHQWGDINCESLKRTEDTYVQKILKDLKLRAWANPQDIQNIKRALTLGIYHIHRLEKTCTD